jgi:glucose/arabinose dehydrogenase
LLAYSMLGISACHAGETSAAEASLAPHGDAGVLDRDPFDAGAPSNDADSAAPEHDPPQVPEGFTLSIYARDLGNAGVLRTHGEHVYLTRPERGDVLRLVDADRDGVAESHVTELSHLTGVHGIAFHEDTGYVATPNSVYSTLVAADGSLGFPCGIMGELPDGGQHPQRTLDVGPDHKLYISVASNPEHTTLLRAELDGSERRVFARGLQPTIGFGWHPLTNALWGRDQSGWLDLTFYEGDSFAELYRNDAFVAVRGQGVQRMKPDPDGAARGVEELVAEEFVTGIAMHERASLAVAPDGALLFTDAERGYVYRVQASD